MLERGGLRHITFTSDERQNSPTLLPRLPTPPQPPPLLCTLHVFLHIVFFPHISPHLAFSFRDGCRSQHVFECCDKHGWVGILIAIIMLAVTILKKRTDFISSMPGWLKLNMFWVIKYILHSTKAVCYELHKEKLFWQVVCGAKSYRTWQKWDKS